MKYVNENPSDKKPYWAFGYPFPCCANCVHFMNDYKEHESGECGLVFDEKRGSCQKRHEGNKACEKYMQDVKRIG